MKNKLKRKNNTLEETEAGGVVFSALNSSAASSGSAVVVAVAFESLEASLPLSPSPLLSLSTLKHLNLPKFLYKTFLLNLYDLSLHKKHEFLELDSSGNRNLSLGAPQRGIERNLKSTGVKLQLVRVPI
jgi:hypothetical protein